MKKQLILLVLMLLPLVAWADDSGSCGNNVTYSYVEATHTLTISGAGAMWDYYCLMGDSNQPWVSYRDKIIHVIIESGVTSIGDYAFYGCSGLTSVTIPNSVTSIGSYAFFNCSGLISVTIPNGVTSIGDAAFRDCSGLTSVTIPNSVTSIWQSAFYGCSGLTSVTIPNSVTSIGKSAFEGCSGLTSVHISDLSAWCNINFDIDIFYVNNFSSNPLYYAHHLYLNNQEVTNLVIPDDVTSIGDNTFNGCSGLTSVTIGNSVTSIGECAFRGCSGLTSVTIPNSVTSIGNYVFANCSGLTSVTIPNSVTSIGQSAFSGCSGLTSVTIPNSVTSIGEWAFSSCSGLTSVTIPNSVTSIENWAFYYCSGLTSVTIPNSVTSIGEEAFCSCYNLTTLTLPEDITIIKKGTFKDCPIKSIVIPAKVEYIYADAFSNSSTKEVKVLATTPPWAHDNAFKNYNIPLYVPTESINSYQSTNPWSKFTTLNTLSGDVVDNKCKTPTISYKNGKLSFYSETEGADFHYTITDTDIKSGNGNGVNLSVTYTVSVYAMKSGCQNSDVATGTLCWIEVDPKRDGIGDGTATAVNAIPSQAVLIQSHDGVLTIDGAEDGTQVNVYTMDGRQAGSSISRNGLATVSTSLQPGCVAIIKISDKSVKVAIK